MMDDMLAFENMEKMLDSDDAVRGCKALYRYIMDNESATHVTLAGACKVLNNSYDPRVVFSCLWALSNTPFEVLIPRYEFHDDEGGIHPLTASDVWEAKRHGSMPHPETGNLLEDYEDKVFLYFCPNRGRER